MPTLGGRKRLKTPIRELGAGGRGEIRLQLMIETAISVVDSKTLVSIFGPRDQYLRKIRSALGVDISVRQDRIHIEGDEESVRKATGILEKLKALANRDAV